MELEIILNGVTHTISPRPGDLVRFEREYNISATELGENARLEYIFFIAYCALKREGIYTEDFESFIDLAEINSEDKETPTAPQQD